MHRLDRKEKEGGGAIMDKNILDIFWTFRNWIALSVVGFILVGCSNTNYVPNNTLNTKVENRQEQEDRQYHYRHIIKDALPENAQLKTKIGRICVVDDWIEWEFNGNSYLSQVRILNNGAETAIINNTVLYKTSVDSRETVTLDKKEHAQYEQLIVDYEKLAKEYTELKKEKNNKLWEAWHGKSCKDIHPESGPWSEESMDSNEKWKVENWKK